jgi:alpha-tubulin suppressor-like RCC1 family protein
MKTKLLLLLSLFVLQSNAQQCWDKISSGAYHTIAISNDGTLWAWGYNDSGQLGDGTYVNKTVPTKIGTDTDWVSISTGYYHSFAIKSNGTLWGWGSNFYSKIGLPGTANYLTPQQVGTATDWLQVSGGENFSLGIKTNGTLWTMGDDSWGQMGNGFGGNHNSPTQVGTEMDWAQVDAGRRHCIALKTNGKIYVWGSNGNGQMSDGGLSGVIYFPTLVTTTGTSNFIKVEAGVNSSLAIKDDNSLWISGLVGPTNTNFFQQFAYPTTWSNVSAGTNHVIGVKSDGTLWAWGVNDYGQISQPSFNSVNTPYQVTGTNFSTQISTNLLSSLVLKNDGFLYGFGQNHVGQLGDGSSIGKNSITAIPCPSAVLLTESFDELNKATLYPNPVSNQLNISTSSDIQKIVIYDISGKQVKILEGNVNSIDVSNFKSGFYIIEITIDGNTTVRKFIKE